PENQRKLADDLGADWGIGMQSVYSSIESIPTFFANRGATSLYGKILEPLIKESSQGAMRRLFKYFVSGAMLSIGSDYIRGIIIFSAQEVLDHPDKFGGVSLDERGALRLLQTRAGFAYYLAGLAQTGASE